MVAGTSQLRSEDICGPHNGRRLYVELGEKGVLRANNVTLGATRSNAGGPDYTNSSHDQCSLELVTCPSCVISLTFTSINLLHHCGDGGMTLDSPCRSDFGKFQKKKINKSAWSLHRPVNLGVQVLPGGFRIY